MFDRCFTNVRIVMLADFSDRRVDNQLDFIILDRIFDIRPTFMKFVYLPGWNVVFFEKMMCTGCREDRKSDSMKSFRDIKYTRTVTGGDADQYRTFQRKDGLDFADTQLPFAGDDLWRVGFEYKAVDPQETGFLIKTGTLILSALTLVVAIASTPYWDPFRNFFKGVID